MKHFYTTSYGRAMLVSVSQKVIEKLQADKKDLAVDLPRQVEIANYNQVSYSTRRILLIEKQISAYTQFIEYLHNLTMDTEQRRPVDIVLIENDFMFRNFLFKYIDPARRGLHGALDKTALNCVIEAAQLRGILIATNKDDEDPTYPPRPDVSMRIIAQELAEARKELE